MYFRFLFLHWSILRQDFYTIGPAAAHLIFIVVAALGAEGCRWNVEWIAPSRYSCFSCFYGGPSSQKHGATTSWKGWIKNNCISRTMQRIQTGLVLLRWWEPAHSNDINVVGLTCSLVCPQRKNSEIYCPIIEGAIRSTFKRYPSAPKAATTTNIGHVAAGSCSFPMVQKPCRKMLQRKNRKRHPKIQSS